jgi:hypothetical protein
MRALSARLTPPSLSRPRIWPPLLDRTEHGIRELAAAAGIAPRTRHRLEAGGVILVSEKKRHGHVQRAVWERLIAAVATAGVELLAEGGSFGAGVRWKARGNGDRRTTRTRDESGE